MNKKPVVGFTLIELMIVMAILGTILAIAVPRFSLLVSKSREANTKGNLGSIRSALSVYYGDCEGFYPTNLDTLLIGAHYLPLMPPANLPPTVNNTGHGAGPITGVALGLIPSGVDDVADSVSGWLYDNVPGDQMYGHVVVNCTHSDVYGDPWTAF